MADRIVVLKDGEVQQVASPQQMYERPQNVFVAGFIGSPAMNFIRARLQREEPGYSVLFGEGARQTRLPLSKEAISENPAVGDYVDKEVILGVRPEHMEDARFAPSQSGAGTGKNLLEVEPEVIESMGSEKYVYFAVGAEQMAHSKTLGEMTDEATGDPSENGDEASAESEEMMVARVSAESEVRHGERITLAIESDKIRLFDPETERAVI